MSAIVDAAPARDWNFAFTRWPHEQALRHGVKFYPEWYCLDLIVEDNVCRGLVAMEILTGIHDFLHLKLGDSLYFILGFLVIISLVAQWRLYEKAGQPGIAAIVPIWNFIVFLKIVGRQVLGGEHILGQ